MGSYKFYRAKNALSLINKGYIVCDVAKHELFDELKAKLFQKISTLEDVFKNEKEVEDYEKLGVVVPHDGDIDRKFVLLGCVDFMQLVKDFGVAGANVVVAGYKAVEKEKMVNVAYECATKLSNEVCDLTDIVNIIKTIMGIYCISEEEVEQKRRQVEEEKGSFAEGKKVFKVDVVRAKENHYEDMTNVRYACYLEAYTFLDRQKVIDSFESKLKDENYLQNGREYTLKAENLFVAKVENKVIALIDYGINKDDEAEVNGLYIHPSYQRKGVGKMLFGEAVNFFKQKGKDFFILHTPKLNVIGRGFYDKMGGSVIKEYKYTLIGDEIDVVIYKFSI